MDVAYLKQNVNSTYKMISKLIFLLKFKNICYNNLKNDLFKLIKNLKNIKWLIYIFNKKKKLTLLRAPFIHNKSKEQFELSIYYLNLFLIFKNVNKIKNYFFSKFLINYKTLSLIKIKIQTKSNKFY